MAGPRYYPHPEDTEAARQFKRYLTDLLFDMRLKISEVAARLNVSTERCYKYFNESTPNSLPAYIIPLWTKVVGVKLLEHIALEAGYAIVKLPEHESTDREDVHLVAKTLKETSETVLSYLSAKQGGRFSYQEYQEFCKDYQEGLSAMVTLKHDADEAYRRNE